MGLSQEIKFLETLKCENCNLYNFRPRAICLPIRACALRRVTTEHSLLTTLCNRVVLRHDQAGQSLRRSTRMHDRTNSRLNVVTFLHSLGCLVVHVEAKVQSCEYHITPRTAQVFRWRQYLPTHTGISSSCRSQRHLEDSIASTNVSEISSQLDIVVDIIAHFCSIRCVFDNPSDS